MRIIGLNRVPRVVGGLCGVRTDPAESSSQTDLAATVFARVDGLSPELRDTVPALLPELTLQETADALGIATSTVKYRLRRALTELQKHFVTEPRSAAPIAARIP